MMTRCLAGVVALYVAFLSACSADGGVESGPTPGGTPQSTRFAPADGAKTDTATGLPTRVVDRSTGIALRLIPAGEFRMGSPPEEEDRSSKWEQVHRRVIRRPFYLGETEVTVGQFRKFVRETGYETDAERGVAEQGRGSFATVPEGDRKWNASATWSNAFPNLPDVRPQDDHPVVQVSWNDARRFVAHYGLRLPSEAQWEYAARAGTTTRFPWGESEAAGEGYVNAGDQARRRRFPSSTNVFFPFDDGAALLSPVGRYRPNAWGLHDMIGNVEEWCEDAHGKYPEDGADETAAEGTPGSARVLRGGSWVSHTTNGRSAARVGMAPASRRDFQGFRVAATVEAVRGESR